MALLHWAFNVVVATFVLLLLSILLWFVFNKIETLLSWPTLSYFQVALIAAVVAISAGGWTLFTFRRTTSTT